VLHDMIPTSIIRFWFLGLFSWVLLGVGIYLSHKWYQRAWSYDFNLHRFFTALERPVIVPLLHLTIWLSPLVWLSNLMSYLNGSVLLSTKSSGVCGTETWEAPNFVTRFQLQASPAVLARGMFGMLRYDATAALKAINVPALVLAGNRDPVCTPEASERMQRDIPGAQMAQLAPAKHMGLIEHHTHFAKIVSQFSGSCLQPNSPHSQC
jgi:pimeloyl-ACP methyl ester carboxylesterase